MAAGVAASANSLRVATFTLLSVAWAERITATSSWNGFANSTSLRGSGFAWRSAEYRAKTLSGFTDRRAVQAPGSADLHARAYASIHGEHEHTLGVAVLVAGTQHHAFGHTEAHLARRQVGDHH